MSASFKLNHVEMVLLLTASSAGAVDVISFATLGGVLASAMTGNFALLAYYVAQHDIPAAISSVVALGGFVLGCALGVFQRHSRAQNQALQLLLVTETVLLFCFAVYSLAVPQAAHAPRASCKARWSSRICSARCSPAHS